MCEKLNVPFISLFCNGTIALITAIKALGLKGEVITTPFSFVATSHSLLWNEIKPVFIDIDPTTLNIDPTKIEAAITHKTTGILPVHVYGYPCDVDKIEDIAKKNQLRVIYDAAHAFGVDCHCGSLLSHGDLSVLSFHATKVFNTFEGGAIVCKDASTKKYIDQLKNFGFTSEVTVDQVGINGKMSEVNAAFGLLQLKELDNQIILRKKIHDLYVEQLSQVEGISCHNFSGQIKPNYGYFPIFVKPQFKFNRDQLYDLLKRKGIYTRKYFYPLLNQFPMYENSVDNLMHAREVSEQILCLPIYASLDLNDVKRITNIIKEI